MIIQNDHCFNGEKEKKERKKIMEIERKECNKPARNCSR